MRLIAGLGNPGKQYANTYHNLGFWVLDELHAKLGLDQNWESKFNSYFVKGRIDGYSYCLIKPLQFMNLSGLAISKLANYYKISSDAILVVHDDLDLPLAKLRYRQSGGHGGHRGIKSTIEHLGTSNFHRLKIGIGRNSTMNVSDYVLMPINVDNKLLLKPTITKAVDLAWRFILKQTLASS